MCGRATLATPVDQLVDIFGLDPSDEEWPARYNIAPTQPIATVRLEGGGHKKLRFLRWGMIPSFAKDPSIGNRMINARVESLATRAVFRDALASRRCLVVVDGFYEWGHDGARRQPYYVHRSDGRPLALAGLWDKWHVDRHDDQGEIVESCTIITTGAVAPIAAIHDRMPLVVPDAAIDLWLDPKVHSAKELAAILGGSDGGVPLALYPVDSRVNSPANEGAENIVRVEPEATLFGDRTR